MSTELTKKVINNIAPITLAEAVYIGDGTDKTLKDYINNSDSFSSNAYDFKFYTEAQGSRFNGLCLTFAPIFGSHNSVSNNVNIEISMDVKVLTDNAKLSYGIHTARLTGVRYDTNMAVSGGQSNVVCNKNDVVNLSYSNSSFSEKKQTYSIIFKYNTLGIEFEIYNFSFKINGVEANYMENNEYMPDSSSNYRCEVNYKNPIFTYSMQDIQKQLLFATSDAPEEIILWGDSITAGAQASSTELCYASLFKTFIETYYQANVTNLAVSGRFLGQWKGDLDWMSINTGIVFIQIGTNDTASVTQSPEGFKDYYDNLSELFKTLLIRNIKVVCMVATPCSPAWISERQCKFEWINRILEAVASDLGMPLISNHNDLLEYCELKNEDYKTYLADGVHPNDKGYAWLFNNIINHLGIRRIPDATW